MCICSGYSSAVYLNLQAVAAATTVPKTAGSQFKKHPQKFIRDYGTEICTFSKEYLFYS